MSKQFNGHHGDLDFFKLDKLPKSAKFVGKFKSHVAQEGETTGHKHVIKSDYDIEVYQIKDRWVYLLNNPAAISHEEHATRTLEPGIYFQDQENEENPWTDMIERVVD